jgi:hypothetical protein
MAIAMPMPARIAATEAQMPKRNAPFSRSPPD